MHEKSRAPREQVILRHLSVDDEDRLVEVGVDKPRCWRPAVEEVTLSLSAVAAFIGSRPQAVNRLRGDANCTTADSFPSLTLSGVADNREQKDPVYGIDISEGDSDQIVATRVEGSIGVDLISRTLHACHQNPVVVPYASEVFVSTDGWYYGDAECIQLLFDIPEPDLRRLYDDLRGGDLEALALVVDLQRWNLADVTTRPAAPDQEVSPIIYGYGTNARLKEWTAVNRLC